MTKFLIYARELFKKEGKLDIQEIEKGFRAAALKDGDAVFRQFLSSIEVTLPGCPECFATLTKIVERDKIIVSLLGTGEFQRTYFKCPNGHGYFTPFDEILGIQGTSYTPGVRLAVSKLASSGSFEWTSGVLEEIAEIYVSPKEVQRISESAGETIEAKNIGRIEAVKRPEPSRSGLSEPYGPTICNNATFYIEYDGSGIPMMRKELVGRNGKQPDGSAKTREVKLGCTFTQSVFDEKGNPVRDKNSTSYVGSIECAEDFGWRIYAEANRRGMGSYARTVIIGDGAKWIWGIADQHFPNAIHIVDLYHAKEHLYGLVRYLFQNQKEQSDALDDWIKELEAGNIEGLVAKILAVTGLNDAQKDKAITEANYFIENADRMRYAKFEKLNLFVGSGVVEAGCKTVIGDRLKQSGMFWSLRGANAIIALRCADLSCNEDLASHFEPKSNFKISTSA